MLEFFNKIKVLLPRDLGCRLVPLRDIFGGQFWAPYDLFFGFIGMHTPGHSFSTALYLMPKHRCNHGNHPFLNTLPDLLQWLENFPMCIGYLSCYWDNILTANWGRIYLNQSGSGESIPYYSKCMVARAKSMAARVCSKECYMLACHEAGNLWL